MAEVRAADLPDGTIVASRYVAHIKQSHDNWQCTNGNRPRDAAIDADLRMGAEVLRHGYGEENQ